MERYLRKLLFLFLGVATLGYGIWVSAGWIGEGYAQVHREVSRLAPQFAHQRDYLRWCVARQGCTDAILRRLWRDAPRYQARQGIGLSGVGLGLLLFAVLSRTTSQTVERKHLERSG
ncbi:MAG: hypothetical protein SFU83_17855 [Meiothermus sp.]|nr:hypothetical protein [Meiothermus sp.]